MLAKVVPILLLTIANVRSGSEHDIPKKELSKNYCDFGVPRKLYDSIDLLRCMNQLASTLGIRESGRSTNGEYFFDRLYSGNEESSRSPWTNLIASLFTGDSTSTYQIPEFPDTSSSQYQPSQYQQTDIGQFGSSVGLNINLFDALYSISRYDDLKCVPRILCEVASGVTPGESIGYSRGSNGFGDFGKNMLLGLLTNFNFVETSPLLSFGKAALLGYTSRGSPRNCYQEYPKCPRNPDQLIYYLNNHNGGFFRFFNKLGLANNPYVRPSYALQRNNEHIHRERLPVKKKKAPSPGFGKINSDRTATGELKFDASILNDTRNYEYGVFPEERIRNQVNRIVFSSYVPPIQTFDTSNRLFKTLFSFKDSDRVNILQDSSIFAPQEAREEEESNQLHATHQHSQSSFRTFVFPDD
ncbi:hypothetical protein KPH14_004664 [Odynerus spinipes]|uniref:Uncharacterized protein n=1 Tax=Odynerus spinipes TaxID=1348599 RepID=A0AAD9RMB0_9HYME|nr:hypothetical protein KPH14_004664 [Odynerus spinipes]